MNVLITGIGGFAGSHLAKYCLQQGAKVYGLCRPNTNLADLISFAQNLHIFYGDLNLFQDVCRALDYSQPDLIFHLAAQTSVPLSWQNPQGTLFNNINGQVNLLKALRGSQTRIHIAGSSAVYGASHHIDQKFKEEDPLRPLTPYGVSKATQELLAFQYSRSQNLSIVCTRAFHHTGPHQKEQYALASFARQIAAIEKKQQEPTIRTGDLSYSRDYCDVRDVVAAYWQLLNVPQTVGNIYNVCSGISLPMKDILQKMLNLSSVKIKIEIDPNRLRNYKESDIICGDRQKIKRAIGWEPQIPLLTTLNDLLNYWRQKIN